MSYVSDWKKLKDDFEEERKNIKSRIEDKKKELKKEKKGKDPDLELIEQLESSLEKEIKIRRQKTGVSQVLAGYEKVLDKMEKMVEEKVDPANKKAWNNYVKALGTLRQSNQSAMKIMQKNLMEVRTYTSSFSRLNPKKVEKILGPREYKSFVGKNKAADDLARGLTAIQEKIKARLDAVHSYLYKGMDTW